jgi:hypothetical protein
MITNAGAGPEYYVGPDHLLHGVGVRCLSSRDWRMIDLEAVARSYVRGSSPNRTLTTDAQPKLDVSYLIKVGKFYNEAPSAVGESRTRHAYEQFKHETLSQWKALTLSGMTILPWLQPGQPYASSQSLHDQVATTDTLFVFLTRCGHGPCGEPAPHHPMTVPSEEYAGGERLLYNDLFRAVHDAFGHVMGRNSFSIAGELRAAFDHVQMYSDDVAPAMLSETLGQVCWFYYGPHLLGPTGNLIERGAPGYMPPRERPYSPQKILSLPDHLISGFYQLFSRRAA